MASLTDDNAVLAGIASAHYCDINAMLYWGGQRSIGAKQYETSALFLRCRRPYSEQAPGQERGQTAPPGRNTDGRRPDEEGRVW